jgi:hypothetical protein
MPDPDNKADEKKGDDLLRRMLKSPPKHDSKVRESIPSVKRKPDGNPAKNDRPEDQ